MFSSLYLKLIGGAVLLIMAIGAYAYVHNLRSSVKDLTEKNTVLNVKLSDQNAAIATFKLDADTRLAAAAIALANAKKVSIVKQGRATVIYKTLPSTPGADCVSDRKSALDLVNGVK